ncbi:IucA/IucC family protein [Psychrobacter alimentarius]|uniref:IucA/IucC family protein n=1 Tax=Psychrobacter alimentarius TaxID=261164 RepID=UPI001919BCE7|nr:IucA/IucC family protein [Psychrobacter alimentarius]
MLSTDKTANIKTMPALPTLYPVQTDHPAIKPDAARIQSALITYLIECVLLEEWIKAPLIEVTTTTDYLASQKLQPHLVLLPSAYQTFFAENNPLLVIQTSKDNRLLLLVESGYTSSWRLHKSCLPVLYRQQNTSHFNPSNHKSDNSNDNSFQSLEPVETVETLLDILLSAMDRASLSESGILKLKESLQAAILAKTQSARANITTVVYAQPHWYQTLIAAEQWGSLMDRPFHPLAKGKLGFTTIEYERYMAEFNQPIALAWVAVAKTHLMVANQVEDINQQNPAAYLLDELSQKKLAEEMAERHLTNTHVVLPVHPWQLTQLSKAGFATDSVGSDDMSNNAMNSHADSYAKDLADGTIVKLRFDAAVTYASASMRSMLLSADTPHSIKLPIGVYALNSKRYLPALKLINGEKNQAILMQARQTDKALAATLRLWDERMWWGYMSPMHLQDKCSTNPYFYQEKPTHLGAMLRILPADLCEDQVRLMPMASLGMLVYKEGVSHHPFDEMIQAKYLSSKPAPDHSASINAKYVKSTAIDYFKNLCDVFLGTMLRCLRLGLAPEMHGQNVVMVSKRHRFTSVLLRDHDSLRIYLPWLARHKIADPEYLSLPNVKNRLYRDSPQALIFYLQSLGILVNIRAIIEALSEHYELSENRLWLEAMSSIDNALASIDFDTDQAQFVREQLLTNPYYPHKTLLLPVIERGDDPHGSMPAGESRTINPFFSAKNIEANLMANSVHKHSEVRING